MQTVKTVKEDQREYLVPDMYDISTLRSVLPAKDTYTAEDYLKLPQGAPYQLIGGKLIMNPSPIPYHQEISRKLSQKIGSFIEENNLGTLYYAPLDVILGEQEAYQPDIIFISNDNANIIGEKNIQGAPDMVIEILSPETAYYDLREKFRVFEERGVKEYWIVDPGLKKIEIYENQDKKFKIYSEAEGEGVVSSKLLDGLSISLIEIF